MCIDITLRKLKNHLLSHDFSSLAEEVHFFKNLKPKFISEYLFYAELLEIETSKPHSGKKNIEKFYQTRIRKIKTYYDENRDLYNYYKRQATYLDHKYFVRQSFDLKMKLPQQLYNYDERFTTSHDPYIANILANDMLHDFYTKKLIKLNNASNPVEPNSQSVMWTAPKVALIELLYALYHSGCLNKGNLDFSHLVRSAEKSLNIDLGNYYKTIGEIKNRKNIRLKFLQSLNDQINQLFVNDNQ